MVGEQSSKGREVVSSINLVATSWVEFPHLVPIFYYCYVQGSKNVSISLSMFRSHVHTVHGGWNNHRGTQPLVPDPLPGSGPFRTRLQKRHVNAPFVCSSICRSGRCVCPLLCKWSCTSTQARQLFTWNHLLSPFPPPIHKDRKFGDRYSTFFQ